MLVVVLATSARFWPIPQLIGRLSLLKGTNVRVLPFRKKKLYMYSCVCSENATGHGIE